MLACFGGAGGQHACAIARSLGMAKVRVHKYAGILSAYGMALADVVHEAQEPCSLQYSPGKIICHMDVKWRGCVLPLLLIIFSRPENFSAIDGRLLALSKECEDELKKQGFASEQIETEPYLHLRYKGTDCALMCGPSTFRKSSCADADFLKTFVDRYQMEFGFVLTSRDVIVDDIRVRGVAKSFPSQEIPIDISTCSPTPEKVSNSIKYHSSFFAILYKFTLHL